ncbi:hypothetical protein D3W54_14650 [Komagataeibacter medellinensis]|uniref:Uncharacterized protein n=1 Tax=Komagataeibacter medellinensis TaxID=1177712 RepID=A0ABQ6VUB5_9PROT|nr:hypothetical protein [Komagataeibacter medellinensis]KAB8122428.1 hypothetical protein D3W54_14650 [Komagataeibacter medellinensis]
MCSSENELISDARQVDLEEMIMQNEEQLVIVRLPLSDIQARVIRMALSSSMKSDQAFIRMVREVGTPIPPCADVETVGYVNPDDIQKSALSLGFAIIEIQEMPNHVYSEVLIRRTDMEAQVAKVAAEKDAEIARLRGALSQVADALAYEINEHSIVDTVWVSPIETMDDFINAALNEGSAA